VLRVELIEQPLLVGKESELLVLDAPTRKILTADECLKSPAYAMKLTQEPQPFGIFNIKTDEMRGHSKRVGDCPHCPSRKH
jgi:hypothetical protein